MAKRTRAGAELVKMSGGWEQSTFDASDLAGLVADGEVVEGDVRMPGDEAIPAPAPDERVCFHSYFPVDLLFPCIPLCEAFCTRTVSSCMI